MRRRTRRRRAAHGTREVELTRCRSWLRRLDLQNAIWRRRSTGSICAEAETSHSFGHNRTLCLTPPPEIVRLFGCAIDAGSRAGDHSVSRLRPHELFVVDSYMKVSLDRCAEVASAGHVQLNTTTLASANLGGAVRSLS